MENSINVRHLHVSYYGNEVVSDVNFSFDHGKLIGIIGPNGAGKSTLMKALLGLIPKDKGEISFQGKTIKEVRKKIAYVPQRNNIDWDFPIIVRDTVLLGTYPGLKVFRRPGKAEKKLALDCLEQVGMEEFSNRQIGELSGGQQQRVFLARALAQNADYFFLDEPFVGIDVASEKTIIKILKDLRNAGKTVFVVHHDLSTVEDYFDELVLINKELIESGPVQNVFKPDLMKKAYMFDFPMLNKIGAGL
jgi:iron/zinc/copper transport system ATP-binding protein